MAGIRTTWTSSLGTVYDLTLDVDSKQRVLVTSAYRRRDGMQRVRVPSMEAFPAPIELYPSLDPETVSRLSTRMERSPR